MTTFLVRHAKSRESWHILSPMSTRPMCGIGVCVGKAYEWDPSTETDLPICARCMKAALRHLDILDAESEKEWSEMWGLP